MTGGANLAVNLITALHSGAVICPKGALKRPIWVLHFIVTRNTAASGKGHSGDRGDNEDRAEDYIFRCLERHVFALSNSEF